MYRSNIVAGITVIGALGALPTLYNFEQRAEVDHQMMGTVDAQCTNALIASPHSTDGLSPSDQIAKAIGKVLLGTESSIQSHDHLCWQYPGYVLAYTTTFSWRSFVPGFFDSSQYTNFYVCFGRERGDSSTVASTH